MPSARPPHHPYWQVEHRGGPFDRRIYRLRHKVENAFARARQFRTLVTHYGKHGVRYRALRIFATTIIWLNDGHLGQVLASMFTVPPDHPLAGMMRRFERADAELRTFDQRIAEFQHKQRCRFVLQRSPGGYFSVYAFPRQPDPNWGIDAGSIASHLRAALDYLVYQLAVEHHGQDPPPHVHQIQFPIYSPGKDFPTARISKWVSPDVLTWLQSVQPQPGTRFLELERLALLTNPYKHRRLFLVAVGLLNADFRLVALRDLDVVQQPGPFRGVVKYGQEVGRGRVVVTGPDPQDDIESNFAEDVVFDERGPLALESVSGVLHAIRDVVERIIEQGWRTFFSVYRVPINFAVEKATLPTITLHGGCGHWTVESVTVHGCTLVHHGHVDHPAYERPQLIAEANP